MRRMTRDSQPPRNNKPSLKYRRSPIEGAYFEFTDFKYVDYAPTPSGSCKQNGRKSEPKPAEILRTSELVSAVGQIWESTNRPLALLQPKTKSRHKEVGFQEVNVFCHSGAKGNASSSNSAEVQYFPVDTMTTCHSPVIQANIEFLKVSKKILFFEPHSGNYIHSLLGKLVQSGSKVPYESWKEKSPATAGVLYDLRNVYGWMSEMSLAGLKHQVNSIQIETKKTSEYCLSGDSSPRSSCNFGDTTIPADNPTVESADSCTQMTKCVDPSSCQSTSVAKASATSLWSGYYRTEITKPEDSSSCQSNPVAKPSITSLWYESKKNQHTEFVLADKSNKPHYGLAKGEHAFAGALAGIFVSLCLHPVDTIKTVIQSCHADQRSIQYIGSSIISERGVMGLYRGIASNIASSAPISAVYTFTYESVKGPLLPFLSKEYQSFAHCISGGCASIASSFIFTPSERIKQQMQVGTHYQNCWKALAGIIKKGGLGSLYAGWGAVLCRNVPHSIIKFYIYESMKQWMLLSLESNAQPNTLQTLICGGLAGSTAALFTTPFDVVKTRLQTQIPGSSHQYEGVLKTLKEISMHEGLKGLYRGLIPRLLMYLSQGAIFFASYESFKRLFSLEVPHLHAPTIGYIQNMEDETQ